MKLLRFVGLIIFVSMLTSCATKILEIENSDEQLRIDEYERNIKLKEIPSEPVLKITPENLEKKSQSQRDESKTLKSQETDKSLLESSLKTTKNLKLKKHFPAIEGQDGFNGRRPVIDPFVPGEKVSLKLSYFNLTAGTMDLEVLPFVQVNNRKSYRFKISGKSNSLFSSFYSIDDSAETYVDYENLTPYNMSISVKETKQLREIRSYFDWKKNKASYWEKKITKKHGLEERQFEWAVEPFSQNVLSAVFYMRTFPLQIGKTIQFNVADNNKNMLVKGHILAREKLTTSVGDIYALKMKPEIEIDGIFKPIGDVFFWLSDDDRKFIVRIESKIKIGTIISSLVELKKE